MRALRRFLFRDGGQSLIEIGIAAPVLIFGLIGGIDLLRVAAVQQAVINAARVGAEFAAADPSQTDTATCTQIINELSRTPGLAVTGSCPSPATPVIDLPPHDSNGAYQGFLSDRTTTCSGTTATDPCYISVRVRYTFRTTISWPLMPTQTTVDRTIAVPFI